MVAQAPGSVKKFKPAELADALRRKLPDYMVPSAFMLLDALPLTANGKVDREALPRPHEQARRELKEDYVAPRTQPQTEIAGIWADILNIKNVGIHDNFFELGGDSLQAIQIINMLRDRFQIDLSLQSLFEAPSIYHFANLIKTTNLPASEQDNDLEEGLI